MTKKTAEIHKLYEPGCTRSDGSYSCGCYKYEVYVDNNQVEIFSYPEEAENYCTSHNYDYITYYGEDE